MIVVDTNVIAYCFVRGALTEAAQRARARDADWHAPFLWRSEFRNVLCGYLRRGIFSPTPSSCAPPRNRLSPGVSISFPGNGFFPLPR